MQLNGVLQLCLEALAIDYNYGSDLLAPDTVGNILNVPFYILRNTICATSANYADIMGPAWQLVK